MRLEKVRSRKKIFPTYCSDLKDFCKSLQSCKFMCIMSKTWLVFFFFSGNNSS